jgi:lipoprotein-anchoring transpeptidase ErfK/SrfK
MAISLVGAMLVTLFFSPTPKMTTTSLLTAKEALVKNYKTEDILFNSRQVLPLRWIDVDLSEQRLSAMQGKKAVYSFNVSTGKALTPTPTGKFLINSKLRYTRMRGPGYDVPNVPYTMYFHEGYGIHGAYWHNNFGTPMSHGCVNVPIPLAGKIFKWASVGTLVVVHK